jgi:signal transduction histidine kinase
MGFWGENFDFEKISLSNEEKIQLDDQIKKLDENRLELFALVTIIFSFIFLFFDIFYFNQALRTFYLIFDSSFFIISLFYFVISALSKKRESTTFVILKKALFNLFPLFSLLWGTAICVLDPESRLNLITFYFVLFIFAFAVTTPLKTWLIYYVFIFAEYSLLLFLLEKPFLTENTFIVFLGCFLILPFYYSFRSTRVHAHAAAIKLKKLNKNLEKEVEQSIRELQLLNNNLNLEVGQRKVIESKLRESLKLVESSNQLKSEFLANISHEIRTPLNSIVGFSEMMTEDGVTPERKKEYQQLVASNTMYLLSTIDDIFDASMLKTDQINPVMKPFLVNSFLDNIYYETNGIELKYQKKDILLIRKNVENPNLMINTDEFYLKKAIIRLVDNAFKFTKQGSIEIGAVVVNGVLEFFVVDTGIGIAEKDEIRIFEPFVQGDGSFTRGYGGSGLGLTIVKGVIRALGADFNFQSTQNIGSKFTISFNKYFLQ